MKVAKHVRIHAATGQQKVRGDLAKRDNINTYF
jgi:hypothetical protein